jgi:molybdenum-dependent DNA-binding transcriptional regulator ModE
MPMITRGRCELTKEAERVGSITGAARGAS